MVLAKANNFEDFITCGLCLCEYDDLYRKPKFLYCNARHTACLSCLKRVSQKRTISCPFCCENFFSTDVASLPNNVYVLHMLKFKEKKGKNPNQVGTSICPTCGSGNNGLTKVIEKQKEAQKQLSVVLNSIQAAEEEMKKLKEDYDFKLAQIVSEVQKNKVQTSKTQTIYRTIPASVSTGKFVLSDDSVFILRIFQSGMPKGEIHISPYISIASKNFLKKLGEFCHQSQKSFNSSVDKAVPGSFLLLSMENPQFQPVISNIGNICVANANDCGYVGISSIRVSPTVDSKIIGWSLILILRNKENFVERIKLPEIVSNSELIGSFSGETDNV